MGFSIRFFQSQITQEQIGNFDMTLNSANSVNQIHQDSAALNNLCNLSENADEDSRYNNHLLIQRSCIQKKSQKLKNTIKIKVQQCKKEIDKQNLIKQCRICLQGQQQGRMVRPCICSGSVTYAHQKCIIQWIKRKQQNKYMKTRLTCEMCNSQFKYKSSKRRSLDFEQFCKNYEKQKYNFILFYIFVILLFVVIFGLVFIVCQSEADTQLGIAIRNVMVKSENIKIIYICIVFILIIILMFLLILFIIEYAVKSELVISEVMNYTQNEAIRRKMKIHPRESTQTLRQTYAKPINFSIAQAYLHQ